MSDSTDIQLYGWNSESGKYELTEQRVSIYSIAKSMTFENFCRLFDDYLNLGAKGFSEGKRVGLQMRMTHRSLQRLVISFTLGIITGIADQKFTDPRNEVAIQTAKKITEMLERGELPFGLYI